MDEVSLSPDLVFDPNDVGPDCVVECWISQGPRATDASFDPQPGDRLTVIDEDQQILTGAAVHREDNRVWVRVDIPGVMSHTA